LTPDAYFDAPARDQEARKQAKKQPAVVLTVPAPSGMSCGFVEPMTGIEPAYSAREVFSTPERVSDSRWSAGW
jgi:hypothetical protein